MNLGKEYGYVKPDVNEGLKNIYIISNKTSITEGKNTCKK